MPGPLLNALCGIFNLFSRQHLEIDIILQARALRVMEVSNLLQ